MEFAFFAYSASRRSITQSASVDDCDLRDFLHAQRLPYELKHLLFKYVHDNVMQQLEKNTMSVHREIESLYLLISLSQIGRNIGCRFPSFSGIS